MDKTNCTATDNLRALVAGRKAAARANSTAAYDALAALLAASERARTCR